MSFIVIIIFCVLLDSNFSWFLCGLSTKLNYSVKQINWQDWKLLLLFSLTDEQKYKILTTSKNTCCYLKYSWKRISKNNNNIKEVQPITLTHSGPRVPRVARGASVRGLHCCRSSAHSPAVSRLRPHSFSSLTIILHQVTLGLPLLCLPWGIHLNATLGSKSVSIHRTCLSHPHLLFLTTTESSSRLQVQPIAILNKFYS